MANGGTGAGRFGQGNTDEPGRVMAASRADVNGGATMRYPAEHGRYFTILDFVSYSRKNPKRQAEEVQRADVVLPLPMNLREYYSIHYSDVSFDKLGGAVDSIEGIVNQYLSDGGMSQEGWDKVGKLATGLSQSLARNTLGYISDDIGGIFDRIVSNIVNPHITAVFKGVGLREHVLTWRFTPRTEAESATVRSIINYIRERMHPEKKNEFLLNFPDEVYVTFHAEDREILFPIYKCVVVNVVAEQSSEGTNAFFRGTDEPVVIDMTVTFKEVESLTREDFTGGATGDRGEPQVDTTGAVVGGEDA